MSTTIQSVQPRSAAAVREDVESVVVRIAGDSGDGIQLTGGRFSVSTALSGNDLSTFPDFPAEIRAPAGTTYGVSAFQINFGARAIKTPGDTPDVLVVMNPAALKVELPKVRKGGVVIADSGSFTERNLRKAGYDTNPLEDGTLDSFRAIAINISQMTLESVKPLGLSQKEALRCKNIWTLGLLCWLYDRERNSVVEWLKRKFAGRPELAEANLAALNAGHAFGETAELPDDLTAFTVAPMKAEPGLYRMVTGSEALAWGMVVGAKLAGLRMFFGSYPITPASPLLHILSSMRQYGVVTLQAEDEISAVCAAIGASYAGALGVTSSSGPGVALKTEAIGLAVSTELPLVVINTQRAGPSTGLPTKTEQSDLYQSIFGRNADTPLAVLAARSPADCFEVACEAVRLATKYMTPVILLSDGFIANASQPWPIPDVSALEPINVQFQKEADGFHPYLRNPDTLARPWAVPGTPGLEHRIGGIEKDYDSGHISYDADNHERMTRVRTEKIARIADDIPRQEVEDGNESGPLAVVGWGSTYGAISRAVNVLRDEGIDVAHIHLRHLWPLPRNLGDLLANYEQVLVPELNTGQLATLLRSQYLLPVRSLSKVAGQPFKISEIVSAVHERLGEMS